MTPEHQRLSQAPTPESEWRQWGPYLSERQWGTVREDYSESGFSWGAFPHDHARFRAYRWGEDGLQGWCDNQGLMCFAPALWNGRDSILKERLFGLGGHEGNHGEDVKECYYYLDSTPTHSYTKALYKYPQAKFPYAELTEKNQKRTRQEPELELADLGIFDDGRYFDVLQEVAKVSPTDLLWRITITNHGPKPASIHLLPSLWFRNVWSWEGTREEPVAKPLLQREGDCLVAYHPQLGRYRFEIDQAALPTTPTWLFTENETNHPVIHDTPAQGKYAKDAFHDVVIHGKKNKVSPTHTGTKAAAHLTFTIPPGESVTIRCRLSEVDTCHGGFADYDAIFSKRIAESDEFYDHIIPELANTEERMISRQGFAGLLWSKQFYYYAIDEWLKGDKNSPPPPKSRLTGRNHHWHHFHARDILSMPDKWEYPWFAAWDTAFHMIPFARIDPDFAKNQLLLMLREWYMHPNGQLPAYEWNFSDVNPPVHAWAVWRVYKISAPKGERDLSFLERGFQKLLLNFTWWVNRKDTDGNHVFEGGFLGLDNIGVFDRSHALPDGSKLYQADGTAWMGFYCLTMLSMALELAEHNDSYEDIASKFFEHFVSITDAINSDEETGLWDESDGFYYDQLLFSDDTSPLPLRTRSLVGLLPLCAVTVLKKRYLDSLPGFRRRLDWFLAKRPDLVRYLSVRRAEGEKNPGRLLLAIPPKDRLIQCLEKLLDPDEFLSPFGIRSLSKAHESEPFVFEHGGHRNEVRYSPGEAETDMFGGNSNWRGPIWFPVNFLIIEALIRYHYFYGDEFTIEYPKGSGKQVNLEEIAKDLSTRLVKIFKADAKGRRPCFGDAHRYADVPHWQNLLLFHEYFHSEHGEGLGASHQTGWTALVVRLIRDQIAPSSLADND